MAFSPADAAFEGFRLARRRPLSMLPLCVITLISAFATYWVMDSSHYVQAAAEMKAAGPTADPAVAFAMLSAALKFSGGLALIGCIATPLEASIVYRGVLRPNEPGLFGLAFGGDEARLIGLAIALVLLGAGLFLAMFIVLVILGGILGALVGGNVGAVLALVLVLYILMGVAALYIGIRMSFAGPDTFARRKLSVFATWSRTRDHFWGLLGCYFLTFFLALLVFFIMFVVSLLVASLVSGVPFATAAGAFFNTRSSAAVDFNSPLMIAYTVVSALFGGLLTMVTMAPSAEAYRQITGADQAEAFI